MDPTSYQSMMVQQLMGQGAAAPGTTGQNASTPYGQSFMTGNQMMPNAAMLTPGYSQQSQPQQQSMYGMLTQNAPSQVLQQPMATY